MQTEWLLKRNCSLSPRQVALAFGTLDTVLLIIGFGFALHGWWLVLAFAWIEVAGLTVAVLHYARHATDRERVSLSERCLLVERIEGGRLRRVLLDPRWTRIVPPSRRRALIVLESRGVRVVIGAFVSEEKRQQIAQELRHALMAPTACRTRGKYERT